MGNDILETDVLIIGAGIAGCRAAIEATDSGVKVVLISKGLFGRDSAATWMATLGYQCWGIYSHDTLDVQVEDTLRCGWFLNNQENVYAFLAHAPDTARELLKWGVRYRMKDGQLWPAWQLGCSTKEGRSIITADAPRGRLGYHYSRVLPPLVRAKNVNIAEDTFIMDLLTRQDAVVGAVGIDIRTGMLRVFKAKATILSTGGYQALYPVATGNPNMTGDGQAMALRAGVDMMDFEFNQTLPCALWPPVIAGTTIPFHLLFNWDGYMYNSDKERFIAKWDPVKMEHSTRAILSRSIFHEIKAGKGSPHGGVYTGATHQPEGFIQARLAEYGRNPEFMKLKESGIDLRTDFIETGYAMHYCQGGCNVNPKCETDKAGLYAIGEAASSSKDGSDRMMSNALPYCMAMGIIAGKEAAQRAKNMGMPAVDESQIQQMEARALAPLKRDRGARVYLVRSKLQNLMARETGYGRMEEGLKAALVEIEGYQKEFLPSLVVINKTRRFNLEWINALELKNMALVAECIVRNALQRTESRGLHDRWDYPQPSRDWFKNIHLRLADDELQQWTTPVEFTYWKPELGSLGEPTHRGTPVREYQGWRAQPLYQGI